MAQVSMDGGPFDRTAYDRADTEFRFAERRLSEDAVEALAREVVRRLAFRMPRKIPLESLPTAAEIDILCAALLSDDDAAADRIITEARRDGVPVDAIYLGYVAGAARLLGQMWEDDRASFVQVTLASGRLYRIIRGLRHIVGPTIVRGRHQRPALFALVPGETHSLGIEIATDLFRREGWDVDLSMHASHDGLLEQAEERSYRAVVLVAHSDRMIAPLTKLVLALRIAQPLAHVVVAGNILNHDPDVSKLVGADAVIEDIETAVATLRAIVDEFN